MNNGKICQFMWFDLIFLSFLAALSEWMSSRLLDIWDSSFYFSFATAVCLIAMIRWGWAGVVVGMAGGAPGIWFSHMGPAQGIIFYILANGFLAIPMAVYGKRSRDAIGGRVLYLSVYVVACHVCQAVGKGVAIFILTGEASGFKDYLGATFLIMVIDVIVCGALRTREGLICDMRYYFQERERENHET